MEWTATLRVDAMVEELRARVEASPLGEGVRVTFGAVSNFERAYALFEGPPSVDPSELRGLFEGTWYGESVIALAIEPTPVDALPELLRVLSGPGAPAGILDAALSGDAILVDLRPSPAPRALVLPAIDIELRRYNGYRRTRLLSPLPEIVLAAIAADGLHSPEIASDRILESLLGLANVD